MVGTGYRSLFQHSATTANTNVDLFMRNFTKDPPRGTVDAQFDLPMDMSGIWDLELMGGATIPNYIWQECLEMTITGPGSPLHHMIHDGKYVTEDVLGDQFGDEGGDTAAWKSIIAMPTSLEAELFGATSTSVFYVDNTIVGFEDRLQDGEYIEAAIRFIGDDGRFYFQQNGTELGGGAAGGGNGMAKVITGTLNNNQTLMPCSFPYDPTSEHCVKKQDDYLLEDPTSFTPACCGEDGFCGDTSVYKDISQGSDNVADDCYAEKSPLCDDGDEEEDAEDETADDETSSSALTSFPHCIVAVTSSIVTIQLITLSFSFFY
eukprot:CAMPEP_0172499214 /NCGR_PEP_ID=MMETSP1066-20121228/123887_1 /TAXON_ID=671091 /ORGANISM="Coscinodiscus wailesii, Strain CCMP2513" /LENGTH=318 /DNA_ID=CAMNT_0013272827 /DNA_START=57 /DNA_END=1013 /DNA_ORIENTATION=+